MPQNSQDIQRELDNDKRIAAGKNADAASKSQINPGGLGDLARAVAAKKAAAAKPATTPSSTTPKAMKKGGVVRGMTSRKC